VTFQETNTIMEQGFPIAVFTVELLQEGKAMALV
jgi:hypothetical protein